MILEINGHHKCRENEELKRCGRICEQTCFNFAHNKLDCSHDEKQCSEKTEDCSCKQGYIRDESTGACVRPNQCSRCDYGESNLPCGKMCEVSCESQVVPKICNRAICGKSDCRCHFEAGFLRDHSTGRCTLRKNCALRN
ncbi:hypothetical protein G9C98_001720 [Cotesia typhae]|uniref:TIL domain-containing protein n=1 Tax=Cotesia typhae TaxID=2053667 RepID=A0A8J5QVY2_9HYME|nr:hypothetical protein G9C98_001720 [Cotesia typhae]